MYLLRMRSGNLELLERVRLGSSGGQLYGFACVLIDSESLSMPDCFGTHG